MVGEFVCVCVKHLHRCKTSSFVWDSHSDSVFLETSTFYVSVNIAGGPWALGWHGPTKTHPSCCANVPAFVFFQKWEEAQPKNLQVVPSAALSKNIDNLFHGCHNLYFAEVAEGSCTFIYFFAEVYCRCSGVYFETHRRNFYLEFQHADQTLWILVYSPVDNFGYSSSFSKSTSCDPFCI